MTPTKEFNAKKPATENITTADGNASEILLASENARLKRSAAKTDVRAESTATEDAPAMSTSAPVARIFTALLR